MTGICLSAALGGFLFGFDTAVAPGTIGFLKSRFELSPGMEGWIMTMLSLGGRVEDTLVQTKLEHAEVILDVKFLLARKAH